MRLMMKSEEEILITIEFKNAYHHLIPKMLKISIKKAVIFPTVLHGCKIWSLTQKEEQVFENKVLRKKIWT
jgi:hypothetical protein